MKKLVSMVMGLAAAAAFAIPVPRTQVLTFSVTGAEKYADGSELADGECFALVWSKDGKFEGINADGKAKREGDEVVYIGKIVKDSEVIFQIEEGFKTGGYFDVWILDTRVFENGEVKSIGKSTGIVTHAAKATAVPFANSSSGVSAPTTMSLDGGAVVAGPTIDPAQIPPMMFTSITVDGDWVVMEAENIIPGVNYTTVADDGTESGITTATSGKIMLIRRKTADSAIIRGMVK